MNISEELSRLAEQRKANQITEEDYQAQRKQLLKEWEKTTNNLPVSVFSEGDEKNQQSTHISPDNTTPTDSQKSRNMYILIAFFLGYMGIHNFYVTRYKRAIIQLIFSLLFILLPVNLVWVLIDMLTVLTDSNNQPLKPLNGWGTTLIILYTLFLALIIFFIVLFIKIFSGFIDLALMQITMQ